ncbi:MAG: ATP-binding protein [Prevotella sp.]
MKKNMEKNITACTQNKSTSELLTALTNTFKSPVEWLRQYYCSVLNRPFTMRQTLLLVNAQAAFFFTVFPVAGPWLLRLACAVWMVHALLKCRKEI